MKMTRHHGKSFSRSVEQKSISQWVTLSVFVVIVAFSLLYTPVRAALTQVLYPVASVVWVVGDSVANAFDYVGVNFKEKKSLVYENEILHTEVTRMQAQVLDRNLLNEKVIKLEEALGRTQSDNRVVAYVLAGPRLSPYDILVVDAGEEDGVAIGSAVVYADAGIIGEVVEVSRSSSKVKLYSSPNEEHAVFIGKKHIPATAIGKGMGNFEAKIPQGSAVSTGDNIISVKAGLLLGLVSLVEENSSMPFTRILFRLPFNITEIHSVEVVIGER